MSTTPTEPTPTPEQQPSAVAAAEPATPPTDPAPAQETDWKAEARKWEARSKENAEAAKRLAEIEEASKTEAQKQAEKLAEYEAKVREYETREQIAAWANEVSMETGVPAVVLKGSTKEELEAHAAQLKPLIGQPAAPEVPRPGAVPTIGQTPTGTPNIPIGEQISAAEQARDAHPVGSPDWKAANAKVMDLKGMQLFAASQTH